MIIWIWRNRNTYARYWWLLLLTAWLVLELFSGIVAAFWVDKVFDAWHSWIDSNG